MSNPCKWFFAIKKVSCFLHFSGIFFFENNKFIATFDMYVFYLRNKHPKASGRLDDTRPPPSTARLFALNRAALVDDDEEAETEGRPVASFW